MKFTLSWLKEFLETEATVTEISEKLTSIGLEIEEVIDYSKILAPFTVAEILATEPHPNADKLQLCTVNAGNGEQYKIVCGASNARAGIKVPLAKVGALIPNGNFEIKKSKIRGIESVGMLCSGEELMLEEESEGILELPENSVVGEPFAKFVGADDALFEIAITPNRGDALGVYGIARDLAAAGLGKLKAPEIKDFKGEFESPIKIEIKSDKCNWFIGVYIKDIKNHQSPEWLQKRLKSIGKKTISAAVDITNYLTFTFGRPAHVFDADKLSGNVLARQAEQGEKILALDEIEYALDKNMLVIADEKSPIAIAGVMGGLDSGVTEQTKNIYLEFALFDANAVSYAGRKLNIISDARYRFERQVDYNSHKFYKLAVDLITDICSGTPSKPEIAGNLEFENKEIEFDISFVKKHTGIQISAIEAKEILTKLGYEIAVENGEVLTLKIPSYRPDVSIKEDIVEEIIRIKGYDNIPTISVEKPSNKVVALDPNQRNLDNIRTQAASLGFNELVTYSFANREKSELFSKQLINIANPISSELDVMRPNLLVNLLNAIEKNQKRGVKSQSYFEVAKNFENKQGFKDTKELESTAIALVRSGELVEKSPINEQKNTDFYNLKAIAEEILDNFIDSSKLRVEENSSYSYYHPGKSASYYMGKNIVAVVGEIHPAILKSFDIKQKVVAAEIFVNSLPQIKQKPNTRKPLEISNFQAVERDFAFTINAEIKASEILQAVRKSEKNLLEEIKIFDIYEDEKLKSEGKKSVAFKVILQPKNETLTDEQINQISENIISAVSGIGGELRSAA